MCWSWSSKNAKCLYHKTLKYPKHSSLAPLLLAIYPGILFWNSLLQWAFVEFGNNFRPLVESRAYGLVDKTSRSQRGDPGSIPGMPRLFWQAGFKLMPLETGFIPVPIQVPPQPCGVTRIWLRWVFPFLSFLVQFCELQVSWRAWFNQRSLKIKNKTRERLSGVYLDP